MAKLTRDELYNRFSFHPPRDNQGDKYESIRKLCYELSKQLVDVCPDCLEIRNAIDRLDEVMFWSIGSIARHEKPPASGVLVVPSKSKE